jgi:hypothetical protein
MAAASAETPAGLLPEAAEWEEPAAGIGEADGVLVLVLVLVDFPPEGPAACLFFVVVVFFGVCLRRPGL